MKITHLYFTSWSMKLEEIQGNGRVLSLCPLVHSLNVTGSVVL